MYIDRSNQERKHKPLPRENGAAAAITDASGSLIWWVTESGIGTHGQCTTARYLRWKNSAFVEAIFRI